MPRQKPVLLGRHPDRDPRGGPHLHFGQHTDEDVRPRKGMLASIEVPLVRREMNHLLGHGTGSEVRGVRVADYC